jgi:hypothetical protein
MRRFDGVLFLQRIAYVSGGLFWAAVYIVLVLGLAWAASNYSGRAQRVVDSGEKPQHGITLRV